MNPKHKNPVTLVLISLILFSTILAALVPATFGQQQLVVTVQTEKPWYLTGERVRILGIVTNTTDRPVGSASVAIEVKDPRNNTVFLDIVYSVADGSYSDSFRLSNSARVGQYTVYVTASKIGYLTATSKANFNVTTEQLGKTTVSIAGHTIDQESNQVKAHLNVTLFSETLNWIAASNRLMLTNPEGTKVYDNFLGIGSPADYKLVTVYNNTITKINYELTLVLPEIGYYTYMFGIYDAARTYLYASTSWMPAFVYTPPPIHSENLGTLAPDSTLPTSLSLSFNRFDNAIFRLTLPSPVKSLSFSLGATEPSRFQILVNQSENTIQQDLCSIYSFTIFNLPLGDYDVKIVALSDVAALSSLELRSGSGISAFTVAITQVETTSGSATPGGSISYHVYLKWTVTVPDVLNVSAHVGDTMVDSDEFDVLPLNYDENDAYLTVPAPDSPGTYDVNIQAKLKLSDVTSGQVVQLKVLPDPYNITIVTSVKYYRVEACFESLWSPVKALFGRLDIIECDSSQLRALSVTDVKVTSVETDENNNPVMATVNFTAENKIGKGQSLFNFGDGPHYNVYVQDLTGQEFLVGVAFAGDEKPIKVCLPVDSARQLRFTIKYRMSLEAELILFTSSVFEVIISAWTSGVASIMLSFINDIIKLTALYTFEIWVDLQHGYMVFSDIADFLRQFNIRRVDLAIELAEEIYQKNSFNPFFSLLSVLWGLEADGEIDVGTLAYAIVQLFMMAINRAKPDLLKSVIQAFNKACDKHLVKIPTKGMKSTDKFMQNLGVIFSILNMFKIIYDVATSPPEEGKMIDTQMGTAQGQTFDPIMSMYFQGPSSNTTINDFGNVYSIRANVTEEPTGNATGRIEYVVDPSMTSLFFSLLSQSTFQHNIFKSFGMNATSTQAEWQEGTNSFRLKANGTMFPRLHKSTLSLNSSWIQGYYEMSANAIQVGGKAWFNSTFTYPYGKNLTYSIKVNLPSDFVIMGISSNGTYTVEDNTITWDEPIDWMAIELVIPTLPGDINGDKTVDSLDLSQLNTAYGSTPQSNNWNPNADTDNDNVISVKDLWTIGKNYGRKMTILGDINEDYIVNARDLFILGKAFASTPSNPNWNHDADINSDLIVNAIDLEILRKNYGKKA